MHTSALVTYTRLFAVLAAVTLLAATASGQAVGFTTPPPNGKYTLQGCSGAGANVVPVLPTTDNAYHQSLFVCPDGIYTGGNLGKVWNELDLVPFRLTTNTNAGGISTYNLIIAGEFVDKGFPGWDVIDSDAATSGGNGPTKNPASHASCSATWNGYFTNGAPVGSADFSIYRVLTITQNPGTTCVWDYYMRLALGSAQYPGSSLHGFKFNSADFSQGAQDVPLPVNQFGAQELAKNMSATQNSDHTWTITKQMSPVNGFDSCSVDNAQTPVTVTVLWNKLQATPDGPITVITNINATNQADRAIFVAVNDTIYIGAAQVTVLGTATNTTVASPHGVLVPAHSNNFPVLTDTQTDNNTSDTQYNDVAIATYFDPITLITIPGSTTATASSPVSPSGTTLDQTASIQEIEGMKDNADTFNFLDFTINSVTDPSGGSFENGYALGSLAPLVNNCSITQTVGGNKTQVAFPYCTTYDSGTLSSAFNATDSGSITFAKMVSSTKAGAVTTGTLGDVATLTTGDTQTKLEADAAAGVSADATVAFTINKTISNAATITFTFHILDVNNANQEVFGIGNTSAPTISFTAGGALSNSVTVNLPTSKYSVHEDVPAHWTVDANDKPADLSINPQTGVAPCQGSVSFTDTQKAHLTLVKTVTNDNGGTAVATDFTVSADGPTPISGAGGAESDVDAGTYNLSETNVAGYTASAWLCVGGTQNGSSVALTPGQSATCTINNNDIAPKLHLRKVVINDNGGTKTVANFTLTADGTGTNDLSGTSPVDSGPGLKADTWALSETNVPGYSASSWVCVGGTQNGSNITVGIGGEATCTITNNDQPGTIIIKKITKPANSGSFGFTTTGAGYNGFTLPGGGQNSQTLNAGTYTVKELTQLGWILTGIGGDPNRPFNCTVTGSGGSTGVGDLNTQTATIHLKNGDTVTCVFENTGQGVTRTQGFWATHTPLANIAWFGGTAFGHTFPGVAATAGIGDTTLCNPVTKNINLLGELMGGFWSGVSKTSTGVKRSSLDQARMQLLQQLLAAELNASAFGSAPSSGTFAAWESAYCGTDQTAIQHALQQAASFNTQGDSGTFTPGTSADSKHARAIANRSFWDVLP